MTNWIHVLLSLFQHCRDCGKETGFPEKNYHHVYDDETKENIVYCPRCGKRSWTGDWSNIKKEARSKVE